MWAFAKAVLPEDVYWYSVHGRSVRFELSKGGPFGGFMVDGDLDIAGWQERIAHFAQAGEWPKDPEPVLPTLETVMEEFKDEQAQETQETLLVDDLKEETEPLAKPAKPKAKKKGGKLPKISE